jgi:hypothetical protein
MAGGSVGTSSLWARGAASDDRRSRPLLPHFALLLTAVAASGWIGLGASKSGDRADANAHAREPAAIAVNAGKARFKLPSSGPNDETLLVVSALAQSRGPFPIQITVRPTAHASAPDRADDGPRRASRLRSPAPNVTVIHHAAHDCERALAPPPRERVFHMLVRDGDPASRANYVAIRAALKAIGHRVLVYADSQDFDVVDGDTVKDIILAFDTLIEPLARDRFGTAHDVDGDGRFTVLLSRWLDHLGGGRYSVDGFVRVSDLDASIEAPFGNRCDMLYLSARLKVGRHLRTVLAHEYMHAVIYSEKTLRGRRDEALGVEEEGWLDEAMAHLFEDMHGFSRSNIDYRIGAFLARPEQYQLVVADYYAANLFRSHGNRGSTYLFLRWCADRYGSDLVPSLLRSELCGTAGLEAVTGSTFASLYRGWSLALYQDGWKQAGPRVTRVDPARAVDRWTALGTTSHFVVADGFPAGAVEFEVTGPAGAELQVTALPLGDDRARLDLSASLIHGASGESRLRAKVRERHGVPVKLTALLWEPLVPSAKSATRGFHGDQLDATAIATEFGTCDIPAFGELSSRPFPMGNAASRAGPLLITIIGIDAKGKRVVAWADLGGEHDF